MSIIKILVNEENYETVEGTFYIKGQGIHLPTISLDFAGFFLNTHKTQSNLELYPTPTLRF